MLSCVGLALVAPAVSGQAPRRPAEPDPAQVRLQRDLDQVTVAATREVALEEARRVAPFDLLWAGR